MHERTREASAVQRVPRHSYFKHGRTHVCSNLPGEEEHSAALVATGVLDCGGRGQGSSAPRWTFPNILYTLVCAALLVCGPTFGQVPKEVLPEGECET